MVLICQVYPADLIAVHEMPDSDWPSTQQCCVGALTAAVTEAQDDMDHTERPFTSQAPAQPDTVSRPATVHQGHHSGHAPATKRPKQAAPTSLPAAKIPYRIVYITKGYKECYC